MDKLRIDIVSDVVCPWCVIGFINLQKAMTQLSPKVEFEINWKPYELHPEIPENGYDKKLYMQQKFGDLSGKASPYKQIETNRENLLDLTLIFQELNVFQIPLMHIGFYGRLKKWDYRQNSLKLSSNVISQMEKILVLKRYFWK